MREQIKRINLYLLSLFIFLIIFNVFSFGYSIQSNNTSSAPQQQEQQQEEKDEKDIVQYVFDNSLTTMLLSTFIIAIIGTLIAKMKNLKKKLDMIEILTKAQVKMKRQADEDRNKMAEQIKEDRKEIDDVLQELRRQIDNVEKETTAALIKYLSENSLNRKR